jgi:hypothetical protein
VIRGAQVEAVFGRESLAAESEGRGAAGGISANDVKAISVFFEAAIYTRNTKQSSVGRVNDAAAWLLRTRETMFLPLRTTRLVLRKSRPRLPKVRY